MLFRSREVTEEDSSTVEELLEFLHQLRQLKCDIASLSAPFVPGVLENLIADNGRMQRELRERVKNDGTGTPMVERVTPEAVAETLVFALLSKAGESWSHTSRTSRRDPVIAAGLELGLIDAHYVTAGDEDGHHHGAYWTIKRTDQGRTIYAALSGGLTTTPRLVDSLGALEQQSWDRLREFLEDNFSAEIEKTEGGEWPADIAMRLLQAAGLAGEVVPEVKSELMQKLEDIADDYHRTAPLADLFTLDPGDPICVLTPEKAAVIAERLRTEVVPTAALEWLAQRFEAHLEARDCECSGCPLEATGFGCGGAVGADPKTGELRCAANLSDAALAVADGLHQPECAACDGTGHLLRGQGEVGINEYLDVCRECGGSGKWQAPPAEPPTVELRPAVKWFAEEMEKKLQGHDGDFGQQGWRREDCDEDFLVARLAEELEELCTVRRRSPIFPRPIIEECADIANFAMMIADKQHQDYQRIVDAAAGAQEGGEK